MGEGVRQTLVGVSTLDRDAVSKGPEVGTYWTCSLNGRETSAGKEHSRGRRGGGQEVMQSGSSGSQARMLVCFGS